MNSLKTKSGDLIKYYDLGDQTLFDERAVAFIGKSKSGKSYIFNSFAKKAHKYYDHVFAFSATADQDDEFPMTLYCPRSLCYTKLEEKKILKISELASNKRQIMKYNNKESSMMECAKAMGEFYKDYSKVYQIQVSRFYSTMKVIKKKLNRLKYARMASNDKKYEQYALTHNDYDDIYVSCKRLFRVIFADFYKIVYKNQRDALAQKTNIFQLDKYTPSNSLKEFLPMFYVKANYRTLVVVNDLGDEFGSLKKAELPPYKDYFNRGRHTKKTMIMLLQGIRQCPAELRTSYQTIIFTSSVSVMEFISDAKIKGIMKTKLEEAAAAVLDSREGREKFTKLVYDQYGGNFYYTCASAYDRCENQISGKRLEEFDRSITKRSY